MIPRIQLANAIRALSMDAVQKANSGHPGMPMGMADIAEVLWNDFLNHNPANPAWCNRDRFILSNGHGVMLQYALLHLTGYEVSIEDLKQFRQLHSKTPGHPEYRITPGVETTTGPLGQGLGNAVGMAIAEAVLATFFNRESFKIVDHYTYCFMGDGCLMEGISHEVASLAGTLGLGKLIAFWDDNGISIDGKVSGWFLDDTSKRFLAYGWHVVEVDGHNTEAIHVAIRAAKNEINKPSLICCKTIIGFGSPNLAGSEKCHGAALGIAEVVAAREKLGWKYEPFVIPDEIKNAWDATAKGNKAEQAWDLQFKEYQTAYPELAKEFLRRVVDQQLNQETLELISKFALEQEQKKPDIATRKASQNTLNMLGSLLPELLGGSADLSESNLTFGQYSKAIEPHHCDGNYLYYGVREFGMSAIMNGIALHGGFIPYGGTFLTFLDYGRNAVRLAALMGIRVIFVYTHDSVGLGEDGPTHQPIEHLTLLRITPNMSLWRPCDATETAVAWKMALQRTSGPTSLALTRQTVMHQPKTADQVKNIEKGGYVLRECQTPIDAILLATGSEVGVAMQAAEALGKEGLQVRVVSMPSTDVFLTQEMSYQETVLPSQVKCRVAVEAGATNYWYQWVGREGGVVGIDRYGESAPGAKVLEALGISVAAVKAKVREVMRNMS